MQMPSDAEEALTRTMTPSRWRPLIVEYENDFVQKTYEDYFSYAGRESAKGHFSEFKKTVERSGLASYFGKTEPFKSRPGAFKLKLGGQARVTFIRGEGDTITIIGNPKHYGD